MHSKVPVSYTRLSVPYPEDEEARYGDTSPSPLHAGGARKAVVDWLCLRLLGPWTYLLELSVEVQTREVLSSPAPIPEDIREAMHVCVKARVEPPNSYCLDGDLH